MKKCKACKTPTKNKSHEGETNPYNDDFCYQCARIYQLVDVFETALNKPNLMGHKRKVRLTVTITK